jgi:hypothetical protein
VLVLGRVRSCIFEDGRVRYGVRFFLGLLFAPRITAARRAVRRLPCDGTSSSVCASTRFASGSADRGRRRGGVPLSSSRLQTAHLRYHVSKRNSFWFRFAVYLFRLRLRAGLAIVLRGLRHARRWLVGFGFIPGVPSLGLAAPSKPSSGARSCNGRTIVAEPEPLSSSASSSNLSDSDSGRLTDAALRFS